ncbi:MULTISPECIES: hypothetical protein [unclassified Bacillus cereus group]|uniref:hypothetical protein n=1 Tax=unclassified Bacillus cereus group TaxID=2750818 RepID=UPI001F56350E|nr:MULTISPECIES: hypothetical protein [unclassified Bacillus cereus group]
MDKPVTISVLGPCVTRDNFNSKFNYDYKRYYNCISLQKQTSIISLMAEPTPFSADKLSNLNEWDTKEVKADFEKII